jgi:hypothetical protein
VAGSEDIDALRDMLRGGRQLWEGPYSLSLWPLVWRDDAWTEWVAQDDHPIANEAKLARTLHMGRSYGAQKQALDERHETEGIDVFVASYSAFEDSETHAIETSCAWVSGVPSLLPETDIVAIKVPPTGESICVPWGAFIEIVGPHLGTTDMYPRRWEISVTLSKTEARRLREAQTAR